MIDYFGEGVILNYRLFWGRPNAKLETIFEGEVFQMIYYFAGGGIFVMTGHF